MYGAIGLIIRLIFFVGYIFNIVAIIDIASEPVTGIFILRVVGIIVFPLGSIMGLLPI